MFWTKLTAISALVGGAAAWGDLGHETVGYVAQAFLAPKALAFVQSSLGSTYSESLGVAATWADSVKYNTGWTWSQALHFIDANDSPLSGTCNVEESRDCGTNDCILTAISNYTTRVQDTSLSATQRQQALMFIDHFLGDVGQPLHVEAYEYGGNDITVTCSGKSDDLHAVWDTGMITVNIDNNYASTVTTYANALIARIKTGAYESEASGWISCSSTTETTTRKRALTLEDEIEGLIQSRATKIPVLECPLVWAQEANAYDCSVVFDYTSGADLCSPTGSYYKAAIPVIDLQLAKQGYRLAAWLKRHL